MTFNSLQYFAFFAVVLIAYYRLGVKGQNRLMVLAGTIFYGAFDWRFLGLLYGSTLLDYVVGRRLDSTEAPRTRKALLATSLVGQLGILGVFKYFDFFAESAADALGAVGLGVDPVLLNVVLPVGISFYTFQTLNYIFAVYRRQLPAERDLVTFAAFVAWFPQLVAGPIERATSLLPQIQRRRPPPAAATSESAVALILRGLFKKVVIADGVAGYVAAVYAQPATFGWTSLVLATIGFAVQVYGDFSGYTDIARGSSRLLGVELRRNFEQPFLSRNMREFWQRWHTSLGSWFVENVAAPLGGARRGPFRADLITLFVFGLIGLWHGAAWTFVFWGLYNGVLVVIWRHRSTPRGQHPMKLRLADAPRIVFTFGLFCLGVIFFRASSLGDAGTVIEGILTFRAGIEPAQSGVLIVVMLGAVLVLDLAERQRRIGAIELFRIKARLGSVPTRAEAVDESPVVGLSTVRAGVLVGVLVAALVVFSGGTPTPFIYFQF